MSWQSYIDTSLLGSGNLDKAIIVGLDKATWASSPDFGIPANELQAIIDTFSDTSDTKKVFTEGIKVNGEKYQCIGSDDTSLKLKKGKEGLVACKTKQAILIGHHPETILTNNAFSTVDELKDYLVKVGY